MPIHGDNISLTFLSPLCLCLSILSYQSLDHIFIINFCMYACKAITFGLAAAETPSMVTTRTSLAAMGKFICPVRWVSSTACNKGTNQTLLHNQAHVCRNEGRKEARQTSKQETTQPSPCVQEGRKQASKQASHKSRKKKFNGRICISTYYKLEHVVHKKIIC